MDSRKNLPFKSYGVKKPLLLFETHTKKGAEMKGKTENEKKSGDQQPSGLYLSSSSSSL